MDYNELLKTNSSMKSLNNFIYYTRKNNDSKIDKEDISNSIMLRDTIVKQNITFNLYLFHYIHTKPPELDDNYDLIPII